VARVPYLSLSVQLRLRAQVDDLDATIFGGERIGLTRMTDLPSDWDEQRRVLGAARQSG